MPRRQQDEEKKLFRERLAFHMKVAKGRAKRDGPVDAYAASVLFLNNSVTDPRQSDWADVYATSAAKLQKPAMKRCQMLFRTFKVGPKQREGAARWASGETLIAARAIRAGRKGANSMLRDMRDLELCGSDQLKLKPKAKAAITRVKRRR